MPRVHYFQRYSQRENVVTNNTLLLFSRIYAFSPARLESLLSMLLGDTEVNVGPTFQQQIRVKGSVPDAKITQPSFSLVIETKVDALVRPEQLKGHLNAFGDEDQKFLMLIQPAPLTGKKRSEIEQSLKVLNPTVSFCATTFDEIIKGCEDIIQDYETDVRELIDDYRDYCAGEGLLPTAANTMRVVVAGATYEENFKYSLYYCPAERSFQPHAYLGLYHDKTVVGIGKLSAIAEVEISGGQVRVIDSTGTITDDDKRRILEATDYARLNHGWDLTYDHRFFLVERFVKTHFAKESKYPLQGVKYFDLRDALRRREIPDVEEIAEELSRQKW
jgi:hypothetical protein